MRNVVGTTLYFAGSQTALRRLAIWNRRLLTLAVVALLWGASVVALQASGPDARAMLAGEGMLIAWTTE